MITNVAPVVVVSPLLAKVPPRQAYVEARFRETQLQRTGTGLCAVIRFDALPNDALKCRVENIAPATGTLLAEVAPESATGSFTRITQRLAVRLTFDDRHPKTQLVRVGMSAVPTTAVDR